MNGEDSYELAKMRIAELHRWADNERLGRQARDAGRGSRQTAIGLLLGGSFLISLAFGMVLLLPPYVVERGGTEADFGLIPFAATLTAVIAIGAIIRHPGRVPPHHLVAIAITFYAAAAAIVSSGAAGPLLIGLGVVFGTAWAVVYSRLDTRTHY